jgi:hypothetical protein
LLNPGDGRRPKIRVSGSAGDCFPAPQQGKTEAGKDTRPPPAQDRPIQTESSSGPIVSAILKIYRCSNHSARQRLGLSRKFMNYASQERKSAKDSGDLRSKPISGDA